MKIYLSPQINSVKSIIKINGEKIQIDDKLYDFTNLDDGVLRNYLDDIISAKRVDGELYVEILNRLNSTATEDELYPKWQTIDGNDFLDTKLTVVNIDWYSNKQREIDESIQKTSTNKERIEKIESENKLLKARNEALSEALDFHEELIVELANNIYG